MADAGSQHAQIWAGKLVAGRRGGVAGRAP